MEKWLARTRPRVSSISVSFRAIAPPADVCGVNHKRSGAPSQRWRADTLEEPRQAPPRIHNSDSVEDFTWQRVDAIKARITANRLLPQARSAGYEGSARKFRRDVAHAKAKSRGAHSLQASRGCCSPEATSSSTGRG